MVDRDKFKVIPVTVYRIIDVSHILTKSLNTENGKKTTVKEKNTEIQVIQKKGNNIQEGNSTDNVTDVEAPSSGEASDTDSVIQDGVQIHKPANCTCKVCGKKFKQSSHLKRHINTHTGERNYKCDICKKSFLDTSTLSRHKKIHTGDKPWTCKICKKSFGTLGSLRRHMTVHNVEGRPFMCSVCSKRFPDNSSYQKHVFIHKGIKPHVCDVCKKAFVRLGDLNGHKKIHIGAKPYKCERCGRRFSKQSNFSRHLLIHEGNDEYTCSACGVGYNFQSSLTRHLLTHVREARMRKEQLDFIEIVKKKEGKCVEESNSVKEDKLNPH